MDPVHDPRFALPAAPAFEPGTSPFRGAGVIYQSLQRFIEAHLPGVPSVIAALDDPGLKRFFGQSFSRFSFYDLMPIPYIGRTVAKLRGVTFAQQLVDSNRWSAKSSFFDSFQPLLRMLNADRLASAIPRASAILHKFGTVQTHVVRPGHLAGIRTGVPQGLVNWYCLSTRAYLEGALVRMGAKSTFVRFSRAEQDGTELGHPTFRVEFEVLLEM